MIGPARLCLLTTGRQDWGILRSTAQALRDDPRFELVVVAGGMHAARRFGDTLAQMTSEGFAPDAIVDWMTEGGQDTMVEDAARALSALGRTLERIRPEALVLVGDRYETASAALAATLLRIPIVHLHGGEQTLGAIDDVLRHSISRMSHLHLVSHPTHAARLISMGEEPSNVYCVGAPGLDNLHRADLAARAELEDQLGLSLEEPVVVVTVHPATLSDDPTLDARAVCAAMDRVDATYIVTLPNADAGAEPIRALLNAAAAKPKRVAVEALGDRGYWSLLRIADAMLGNSSSGLIEAPVLQLPAVDVGERQRGRMTGGNVLHSPAEADAVTESLRRALDPAFRASLTPSCSPFGDGHVAPRIVEILAEWTPPSPPAKPDRRLCA